MMRRFFGVFLIGVAALAAVAPGVRAQQPISLDVAIGFFNLDAVPVWAAVDKGFFQRYGLDVKLINTPSGSKSIQAMVAGDVSVAFIAGATVLTAAVQGHQVEMIGGLVTVMPYDLIFAKNITDPKQLEGQKCVVSTVGTASDLILRYGLKRLGVDVTKVTILPAGNEMSRIAAMQSGQVQCTVLTAGLDLTALRMGFRSGLKLYETGQMYQHSGIGAKTPWVQSHKDVVMNLLKAITAGLAYLKNPAHEESALDIAQKHLGGISRDELKQGFKLYRDKIYPDYPFVSEEGMAFILRERKIDKPARLFMDNSFVQQLKDENFAQTVGGK